MMNESKPGYSLEYKLIQQTPIIHFQPNQSGASLRATEVKPKLDRFIVKKIGGKSDVNKSWFLGDTDALNYKMTIVSEKPKTFELGPREGFDIFYGNSGVKNDNRKKGIIHYNISLTITCFVEELRAEINNCIEEFFAVTNFGTMQNKGFGSFLIKNTNINKIPAWLRSYYGAEKCYSFTAPPSNFNANRNNYNNSKSQKQIPPEAAPFAEIKKVYSIMKSGINHGGYQRSLLFLYMHKHGIDIDNEKAWLKHEKLAPSLSKGSFSRPDSGSVNPKYVRALLGVGDHIDFKNDYEDSADKTEIRFKNDCIDRLESCIFFKVIKTFGDTYTVYFLGKRINPEIYGKEFQFNARSKPYSKNDKENDRIPADLREKHKKGEHSFYPSKSNTSLSVPTEDELPENFIDDFLDYCCKAFNGRHKTRDGRDDTFNNVNPRFRVQIKEA